MTKLIPHSFVELTLHVGEVGGSEYVIEAVENFKNPELGDTKG